MVPLFVDGAETIRIAVERQTHIGLVREHGGNQMAKIFRLRRVRMVVGKMAVHFKEKLGRVAIQFFQNAAEYGAGRTVPGVGNDLNPPRQFELRRDLIDVWRGDVDVVEGALRRSQNRRVSMSRRIFWISSP